MEPAVFDIGDRASFEVAFRTHYAALCGFASGYIKDIDQAEDLVQDLFVRIWEDREKLKINTSLKSYLFTSVRNRCLSALRTTSRMRSLTDDEDVVAEESGRNEMELGERSYRITLAIEALPEERRKVFKLSRYEGLKYQEIAEHLGISVKTVENQMGKALKTLRTHLADLLPTLAVVWSAWLFGGG